MLESRLARSKLGRSVWPRRSGSNSSRLACTLVQRLCVCCEVPLDVAQFDVWPGVAHDAAQSRTRSQGITSASPERAFMSVSIASIMSRRVGHELARKEWSSLRTRSAEKNAFAETAPAESP